MSVKSDVTIVGGGVVGAACARELTIAGLTVQVIDPEELPGDTPATVAPTGGEGWKAAAGMLAPQVEARDGDPLFDLGLAGREYYATRAEELKEDTGIDIGFWQGGIVRIARSEADVDVLKARVAWQRQHGHVCDWLAADEVGERWPWLAPTEGALWAPRDGALHPEALVRALLADAKRRGATRITDRIVRLEGKTVGDIRLQGERGSYAAPNVVLAAGAWSGRIQGLPRPVSVEPIRGQMAALPWPEDIEPAIVYGGHGSYVVWRNGQALLGSTMEHMGFDATTTDAAQRHLLEATASYFPALLDRPVLRSWSGLRPVTPDGLPIIGPEPRLDGLWYATGHGRNGILLSGITGTIVQQQLTGEATIEGLEPMRPERFWEL